MFGAGDDAALAVDAGVVEDWLSLTGGMLFLIFEKSLFSLFLGSEEFLNRVGHLDKRCSVLSRSRCRSCQQCSICCIDQRSADDWAVRTIISRSCDRYGCIGRLVMRSTTWSALGH